MGFERVIRTARLVNELSLMPSKRKLLPIWETLSLKNEEQLATLVPGRDQLVLAAHPAGGLQDTALRGSPALVSASFALFILL